MRNWVFMFVLICFVALLSPAGLPARQPVVISGKVTDVQHRPIPKASVTLPALNESAVSDGEGMYHLVVRSKVRSGQEVVIRASREGFDYASRPVRLAPGAQLRVNFRLVPVR